MLGFARRARNVKGEQAAGRRRALVRRFDEGGAMNCGGFLSDLLEQARLRLAARDALLVARRMERNVERRAEGCLHADDARLVAFGLDLEIVDRGRGAVGHGGVLAADSLELAAIRVSERELV